MRTSNVTIHVEMSKGDRWKQMTDHNMKLRTNCEKFGKSKTLWKEDFKAGTYRNLWISANVPDTWIKTH
jgi:hypothetical protein